ncbi:MAG: serine/threonine-protein kinase [Nannocystaceae bacterium]
MRIDGAIALDAAGPPPALCPGCLDAGPRDAASCAHCGTLRHLRGRYWLDVLLGAQGSARTFRASDSAHAGRAVIVKELALHGAKGWKEVELFERSVKVLRGLCDLTPGIPRYVDHFDTARGGEVRYYLVYEWIPGESLAARLAAGERFDEARARALARELLATLAAIHGLSPPIVHRDVKPANVIDRGAAAEGDGRPRYVLIDFDLVQDRLRPGGGSTMSLGTAGYAPLEQLMGRALPASDLYGLGATLVALLSREDPTELYDPALQRLVFRERIRVSEAFAALLDRLLAPAVDDRYEAAADVLKDLGDAPPPLVDSDAAPPQRPATEGAARPSTHLARRAPAPAAPIHAQPDTGRAILALLGSVVGLITASVIVASVLQPTPLVAGGLFFAAIVATFTAARRQIDVILRRHDAAQLGPGGSPRAALPGPRRARSLARRLRPSAPLVVEVGVGLEGVTIGASTVPEVLEIFGDDCTCYAYDAGDLSGPEVRARPQLATKARIWKISYDYDAAGDYTPSRPANRRRPSAVHIDPKRGVVKQLDLGVYQSEIVSAEGLAQSSALADVERLYGDGYVLEGGGTLDKYRYAALGLEVWVNRETKIVNSFRVFAPEG